MIQWILFDKDGTLIYFDQSWTRIGIQLVDDFIERYRASIADVEQAYKDLGVVDRDILPGSVMASGSLEEMIAHFNQIANRDVSDWVKEHSQTLIDQREPDNEWVDGVYEMLETLRQRGYKLAIVTSDTRKGTEQFLEATDSEHLFDVIISTEAHAVEKPNPEVLKPLFEQHEVQPEEIMMVGDTPNDIQTAINAQLGYSVAVLTGVGEKESFTQADRIVDDATAVLDILNDI
ncbi:HAD family hydrolase [Staphylococcus argensis]